MAFTPATPYLATRTDSTGRAWQFAYWGAEYVYIREVLDDPGTPQTLPVMGEGVRRDDWPFLISLSVWHRLPQHVSHEWLDRRCAVWIDDRNDDIASGNAD